MGNDKDKRHETEAAELRQRAEKRLRTEMAELYPTRAEEETQKLLHELQVHQIELEMQNEELRNARSELESALAHYADLYDFAPVGYATLGRDGTIHAVNLTGSELLGIERSLVISRRLDNFLSVDTRRMFHDFLDKVFASETKETCEVAFLNEGESPRPVQIEAVAGESGRECRAAFIDIAERKKSEEGRVRLSAIVASSGDAIIGVTPEGMITSWNPGAETIYGYSADEIMGRHISLLAVPDDFDEMSRILGKTGSGERVSHFETVHIRKDCREINVSLTVSPIKDAAGNVKGGAAIARDITGRIVAENRLRYKRQQLEELNLALEQRVQEELAKNREKDFMLIQQSRQAAMGEMIDNIAHQWRQPLNALSLLVQTLHEEYHDGQCDENCMDDSVNLMTSLIQHMSQTIDDFRDFSRPDRELKPFDLKELVSRTLLLIGESLKARNISVAVDAEENLVVTGNAQEFTHVLLIILNNARDALTERHVASPRITIRLFREAGRIVAIITDNAGGIPEENLGRIFEPYYTTKGASGTGIGLYISRSIVEKRMDGKISVTNTDQGAEFRIEL